MTGRPQGLATGDLRLAGALGLFGVSALALMLPQLVLLKLGPRRLCGYMPFLLHKAFCRSMGVMVRESGARVRHGPVLFVVNHMSWLDVPVLGSRMPASFVAKAEVSAMGPAGLLARLQRTIFIERERRHQSATQRDAIHHRLEHGDSIILFPEGTSSNGNTVLPFKSSLFGVAEAMNGLDLLIQPVTLAYTHLNGMPMSRAKRHRVAWVGDEEFLPHLRSVAGLGRISAHIQYHEPVRRADFANRKALAQHCERVIADGLRRANAGRLEG